MAAIFFALMTLASVGAPALPRHATFGAALADRPAGVTVTIAIPHGAAATAGIQAGDVILQLAGVKTPTVAAFLARLHLLRAQTLAETAVLRNGKQLSIPVMLGRAVDEADPDVTTIYGAVEVDGSPRRTLLTIPVGATSRLPTVLFIGGIGCYSVDVAANPQDAYLHLAHDLSRAGFATMRLEKSGVGDSQGRPCRSVDFYAEERSYNVALKALQSDPHVDPNRIYLFGHSIGTTIAPRLAAGSKIAGIIAAEGVGRNWLEYELRNARRQLELSGASPVEVDAEVANKYICMYRLLVQKQKESTIERDRPACKAPNGVYPVDAPYVQQVAALDILGAWSRVTAPILLVYGRSDYVTEEADHARIADYVNSLHPGNATLKTIDGMDHFLFTAASPKASADLTATGAARMYDITLSDVVVQWLRTQP